MLPKIIIAAAQAYADSEEKPFILIPYDDAVGENGVEFSVTFIHENNTYAVIYL